VDCLVVDADMPLYLLYVSFDMIIRSYVHLLFPTVVSSPSGIIQIYPVSFLKLIGVFLWR